MLNQSGASHIGIIADIAHSKAFGDIDHILKEADGILFQVKLLSNLHGWTSFYSALWHCQEQGMFPLKLLAPGLIRRS